MADGLSKGSVRPALFSKGRVMDLVKYGLNMLPTLDVSAQVRRAFMVEGMSIGEATRVFRPHREPMLKMLHHSVSLGTGRGLVPDEGVGPPVPGASPPKHSQSSPGWPTILKHDF